MELELSESKITKMVAYGVKVGKIKLLRKYWTKSDLEHFTWSHP